MAWSGFDAEYSQEKYSAGEVTTEADNSSTLEEQRAQEATAGGVRDARFLGYAEVLSVYADRPDVETLADRRARHLGTDPAQQSFTRDADYDAGAGTSAKPQTEYPGTATQGAWTEEDHTAEEQTAPGE